VAIGTGDRAPDFDLAATWQTRVRLEDFLGRTNLLLVFHPFAFTPICNEEALDLQESLDEFRRSGTEVVLVACEPSATRQAWQEQLGLEFTVASDFWPHGAAAKAYGVFDEESGAAVRGTFLIDKGGTVIWSLVNDADTRRAELVGESLDTLGSG
jgi:mycoredoxin-dependent peroxiredoxin